MTSKTCFLKKGVCDRIWGLMKEDIKRRIWVLALMFLVFLCPSGKAGISYGKCPTNGVSRL